MVEHLTDIALKSGRARDVHASTGNIQINMFHVMMSACVNQLP